MSNPQVLNPGNEFNPPDFELAQSLSSINLLSPAGISHSTMEKIPHLLIVLINEWQASLTDLSNSSHGNF